MPDLDLIKQEEQGARAVCQGSLRQSRRRPRGVNRPARLLRAGEGEALTPQSRRIDARRQPGGVPTSPSHALGRGPLPLPRERQSARAALLAATGLCKIGHQAE